MTSPPRTFWGQSPQRTSHLDSWQVSSEAQSSPILLNGLFCRYSVVATDLSEPWAVSDPTIFSRGSGLWSENPFLVGRNVSSIFNVLRMNYYDVLGLSPQPTRTPKLGQEDIKIAYRRALLQHHPDKSKVKMGISDPMQKYTIDEVTFAYHFLSDITKKAEYDRSLRLLAPKAGNGVSKEQTGLESVDLDDMAYDESQNIWFRNCRCGDDRGFRVTEKELENEAQYGEIITGCNGCSLWLCISFQESGEP